MSENATVTVAWELAHPLLEGHVLDVSVSNELVTPRLTDEGSSFNAPCCVEFLATCRRREHIETPLIHPK